MHKPTTTIIKGERPATRGPRIRTAKRGHQESRREFVKDIDLDTSFGLAGVFHQVAQVVCKPSGNLKFRHLCLAYINNAVRYIGKISKGKEIKDINTHIMVTEKGTSKLKSEESVKEGIVEDWNNQSVKEKYFCLFRCALLHKRKEVRVAGLRLLRYMIKTECDVESLLRSNCIPLIVRCIDINIDNHNERVQAVRLARHMMQVVPHIFPPSLARCLISIAKDGAKEREKLLRSAISKDELKERDKLLRSAQAIINELAIFNPSLFVNCDGVSTTLYNILDCPLPRVNEALMSSLIFLLNDPKWRPACAQFHMIMAPFSDIHHNHHELDSESIKNDEREMRVQSSSLALLAAMRSWAGFITLYQPQERTIQTLIDLLSLQNETTKKVILDFLFELLRFQVVESLTDYDQAVRERSKAKPPDADAWRLNEGFVVAEAKALLPHIAKFRPNLIQNYFSLILYTLIKKGLLESLCEVIISSSQALSIKATILLGEILYQADQNLPDCGLMSHALPTLSEKASGTDNEKRLKASHAITTLLQLSRVRLASKKSLGMSLYLKNILNMNKEEDLDPPTDPSQFSKWLGRDHDDHIMQTLKSSGVFFISDSLEWKWQLLIPVLRWPSSAFLSLEDALYRTFIKKLLHHFKPSSKLFSRVDATHASAHTQAEALVLFTELLLNVSHDDQEKYLIALLEDISAALKNIACEMPFHDSHLSPSHLNMTVGQYYFLAIGSLTRLPKGYDLVLKAGIYEQMMAVIDKCVSYLYAKLFISTLDYSIDGLNRVILTKILTSTKECSRMYATQFMRVLVRARARDFTRWGIELLVGQLYDESKLVALAALEVLDEALDDEEYLEAVLKNPPSVQHLGDNGQLLLAKLVASPQGFRTYHDCNFISTLLDKWANTFNLKYVKLMQTALAESLTQLQRGEDGLYGRRTGSKHVVHDVFVLPHLYGSLTLHKEGLDLLIQHEALATFIETVREGNVSNLQSIFRLKSALWALGHLGRSSQGVSFLKSENVVSCLVKLAANCPVYSVRGTVFHALCLISTTWDGANLLQKLGWDCIRRHHHQQLQLRPISDGILRKDSSSEPKKSHNHPSESDCDDVDGTKAGFYFMDESEDETEMFPLIIDDLDVGASRKSQTLPHDSKPSSYLGHQRSFSDCADVIEELTGGAQIPSSQDISLLKRSTQIKNKILSSFRRKSKRQDSIGSSRTSNSSSASEKMFSFLHSSRRRKRGPSFGSSGPEEDVESSHSQSYTDEELTTDDVNAHEVARATKLSPIASGTSLRISGELPLENRRRKTSLGDTSLTPSYAEKKNYFTTLSPPHQSSIAAYGGHKFRGLPIHKRGTSESSHEEIQSKNSLRLFLSSSYDQSSLAFGRGLVRSPSGCSELSSVRSYGALGTRGGSTNWLLGRGREGGYPFNLDDDPSLHPSGQCFLGLALPLNIDDLLLDSAGDKSHPNTLGFILEEFMDIEEAKSSSQKMIDPSVDEDEAFEFHARDSCLSCYSYSKKDITTIKVQEDGKMKCHSDPFQNRYLVRKEILKFVANLISSYIAKSSEAGLLSLKTRLPWAFQDPCLYAEVCALLSSYTFRLSARRFIQELFLDLALKEVFEDSRRILASAESMYESLNEKMKSSEDPQRKSGDDFHHEIPEYNINDFEGFDMDENC